MKLTRPYIPLVVRVEVTERQCRELGISCEVNKPQKLSDQLADNLKQLFGDAKHELHHRPALVNRHRKRNGCYDPPANDPRFLVYLLKDEHDVETRIRGPHGQYSDLALRRKLKRIERNRDPKRRKKKIPQRVNPWPKRKFASRRK